MNLKAMFFKKFTVGLLSALSIGVVLLAVANPDNPILSKLPFTHSVPINSISGLPGGDGPVLVVKIDDTRQAHPQIGLEDADIVYIEQVEGGLTRLAAIFSSRIPSHIGPVRSARISDIELLEQYHMCAAMKERCGQNVPATGMKKRGEGERHILLDQIETHACIDGVPEQHAMRDDSALWSARRARCIQNHDRSREIAVLRHCGVAKRLVEHAHGQAVGTVE